MKEKRFRFPYQIWRGISPAEGKLLYGLAQLNPHLGVIVELGSYHGCSTICLAQGSRKVHGGKIYTVDHYYAGKDIIDQPSFYQKFCQNITSWNLGRWVKVFRGETVNVAKKWHQPIRLLFIDASHFYKEVKADWQAWQKFLVPGGMVVFHDSLMTQGVHCLLSEIIRKGHYHQLKTIKTRMGISWLIKNKKGHQTDFLQTIFTWIKYQWACRNYLFSYLKQLIKLRGDQDFWYRSLGFLESQRKNYYSIK